MSPSWLSYAEIYHCRWAMLGAAGCIFPEIFANLGIIPQTPSEVTWFRAGVFPPAGSYNLYWTGTLPGSQAWTHHLLPDVLPEHRPAADVLHLDLAMRYSKHVSCFFLLLMSCSASDVQLWSSRTLSLRPP